MANESSEFPTLGFLFFSFLFRLESMFSFLIRRIFALEMYLMGVLATKKVARQMRGTALGAYVAFVDLSLGMAGPFCINKTDWM